MEVVHERTQEALLISVVRWLTTRLPCVERRLFSGSPAVPLAIRQLWLDAVCDVCEEYDESHSLHPSAGILPPLSTLLPCIPADELLRSQLSALGVDRLPGPRHELTGPSRGQLAAAFSRLFWCPRDRGDPCSSANNGLALLVRPAGRGAATRGSLVLQLWHCHPSQMDIAAFSLARWSVHTPAPPDHVPALYERMLRELDGRVLWIGARHSGADTVSVGYYLGRCEQQDGSTVVDSSSVEDCLRRRQQLTASESTQLPLLVHDPFELATWSCTRTWAAG